ncbi:polysaccharide deacetylase family protein [bacterium]|nr:polysaccharide deacetylase family protein [bacterium]
MTRVTPNQFRHVLEFLKQEDYHTISLHHYFNPASEPPSKPIVITFDDSYESVYTHAFPLLEAYGFTATVFVISGYAGKINKWDVNLGWCQFQHLSWDQIVQLKNAGFEIGSHTVHHPDLTRISSPLLKSELEISKKQIEDKIGEEVRFISFPFGRYNQKVIEMSREAGYQRGCGFWIRSFEKKVEEKFVFQRKAYYLFDGIWNLKLKLRSGAFTFLEEFKLRIVNFCSHGTSLVKPVKSYFDPI